MILGMLGHYGVKLTSSDGRRPPRGPGDQQTTENRKMSENLNRFSDPTYEVKKSFPNMDNTSGLYGMEGTKKITDGIFLRFFLWRYCEECVEPCYVGV